jgi:hypothetical protein
MSRNPAIRPLRTGSPGEAGRGDREAMRGALGGADHGTAPVAPDDAEEEEASPVAPALSRPAITTTVELPMSGDTDASSGCTWETPSACATCAASARWPEAYSTTVV